MPTHSVILFSSLLPLHVSISLAQALSKSLQGILFVTSTMFKLRNGFNFPGCLGFVYSRFRWETSVSIIFIFHVEEAFCFEWRTFHMNIITLKLIKKTTTTTLFIIERACNILTQQVTLHRWYDDFTTHRPNDIRQIKGKYAVVIRCEVAVAGISKSSRFF